MTYWNCFGAFRKLIYSTYPELISLIIHIFLVICIIVIVLWGLKTIEWKSKVLVVILGILMPFAMNVSHFINNGSGHSLMHYAVWVVYLLALILVEWLMKEEFVPAFVKRSFLIVIVICIFISIGQNIQTANVIYVKKDMEYQSTLSYMTRVLERLEEQEGYVPGETEVMFIGEDSIGIARSGFERYSLVRGMPSTSPITYYDLYKNYFEYVLGTYVEIRYRESMLTDERVLEMPIFPEAGSIKMIDGLTIVKLEDNQHMQQ